ncbi:uncharacterized protein A4U43_C03F23670 [Asparagus officinalis]|uniref:Pre-mRNA polyadenylation factor Fip1 domain-containing protein n=1 Tax=Asparagus officinalis TaxID=4686 RepID=A0A5P1FHL4_ASPOF|nr:FIP1[V]-like protein [Asparagus officinalis]ONK76080.1 uncharacterized protein A4U43_C03F23670 [Asparagus officinalis]
MNDDDDFGGLYADILLPLPSAPTTLSLTGGDHTSTKNPSPGQPLDALAPFADDDPKDDLVPDNWSDDDQVPVAKFKEKVGPGVSTEGGGARVFGSPANVTAEVRKDEGARVFVEEKMENGDLGQEPTIPGLSAVPLSSNGSLRISNADDWDSDSDDDLQIVLNDNRHMPMGNEMNEENDDGEEDLVIVTDEHHQAAEEQDWGEGELQLATDGDTKGASEAATANGAVGSVSAGPRIGHRNQAFHPQHNTMFKYIRPGTAAPGAPTVGPPGQIRPPTMDFIGGRGRGDWRPAGRTGFLGGPKGFHSGFRPGLSNNSSRAFGGGLDFTLPSYKTIFEVDIESFEEKPWRHPGVDISIYFNFDLDEDKWKEYSKQLDQLRLESTMRSKIHVYESGRSEHEFDPDLPPELAAAAGHHDISADNTKHGKLDLGHTDLHVQGRGLPCIQAPFPPGRAIPVEIGCGERLPSIDTRPPRARDADAVIEIMLQGCKEDSIVHDSAIEKSEKDMCGEELAGVNNADGDRRNGSESYDRFAQSFGGHCGERGSRRLQNESEDNSIPLPPESPLRHKSGSRLRSPLSPSRSFGTHRAARLAEGPSHGRHSSASGDRSTDSIPIQSAQNKKHDKCQKGRPTSSMEADQTPKFSLAMAADTAGDLSIGQKDGEHDDMLALGDSIEVEEEETSDIRISGETLGEDNIGHSSKKQKRSSRVDQTAVEDHAAADDDLKVTRSDNSRAKYESSNQKRRRIADEEIQGGRSKRDGDMRRHHEEENPFYQRDDYGREGRHEMGRRPMDLGGRGAMYNSYSHIDWDSYAVHPIRDRSERFERPREVGGSFWQRREEDTHRRRLENKDIRWEYTEEAGSRNRNKVRVSDRINKDNDTHFTRRLDDGDWRGHNRGGLRLRENDDVNRRDNVDDRLYLRRERTEKEDSLHGYRAREDSSRRKREKDGKPEHRRREDGTQRRNKAEDRHSSRRQREREDRQQLKHSHEDSLHREREEGRGISSSGRAIENKPLSGCGRNKGSSKLLASDKDYQHKDRKQHAEQSKREDQAEEENDSHSNGLEDIPVREKHHNEERSLSSYSQCPSSSDKLQISREKHKDTEGNMQNPAVRGKRKHEDQSAHHDKDSSKGINEQGGGLASDDESQHESKRGRSKIERWASPKERDYSATNNVQLSSSSITKEVEKVTASDIVPIDELPISEGNDDKSGEDLDQHLDTVEKLKRQSERFKLPMLGDKDVASLRGERPKNDTQLKPERPPRKRKWTSS